MDSQSCLSAGRKQTPSGKQLGADFKPLFQCPGHVAAPYPHRCKVSGAGSDNRRLPRFARRAGRAVGTVAHSGEVGWEVAPSRIPDLWPWAPRGAPAAVWDVGAQVGPGVLPKGWLGGPSSLPGKTGNVVGQGKGVFHESDRLFPSLAGRAPSWETSRPGGGWQFPSRAVSQPGDALPLGRQVGSASRMTHTTEAKSKYKKQACIQHSYPGS